jgi:hypothetical protein
MVPEPQVADLKLRRQSDSSFFCADIPGLARWLEAKGLHLLPSRSLAEYCRIQGKTAIVVLYNSGSVLCQGANPSAAVALLEQLELHP